MTVTAAVMSLTLMPHLKRQKLTSSSEDEPFDALTDGDSLVEDEFGSTQASEDEEIENLKPQKSRSTLKRKIRATTNSKFGATLKHLLSTEAPSSLPLSLKPSVARKRNDDRLELRAKRVLQMERKEKEDNARITDVIGGWGGENERALRKVAQRGVVRLFNVIQQSQLSATVAEEEAKINRGSGKPSLPAPSNIRKGKSNEKHKDNILGRAKDSVVEQDDFFNMIKSGGVVSKA